MDNQSPYTTDKEAISGINAVPPESPPSHALNQSSSSSYDLLEEVDDYRPDDTNADSPTAEKILIKSRRCRVVMLGVETDTEEAVSDDLAEMVKSASVYVRFDCREENTELRKFHGQAGILRFPNGDCWFATAIHNVTSVDGLTCLKPHECHLANETVRSVRVEFNNTGRLRRQEDAIELRDGFTWKWGLDITIGPPANSAEEIVGERYWSGRPSWEQEDANNFLSAVRPLDVVPGDFTYEQGMKIGIIVNNRGVVAERVFSEVGGLEGDETIEAITGQKGNVIIYTGEITVVGPHHIEYNANTHSGCSGGIVIVMDPSHQDYKKALAVHAGYKGELRQNLGFKITAMTDYYASY